MNWKCGFSRLWVIGACGWATFWILALQEDIYPFFETLFDPQKIVDPFYFSGENLTRSEMLETRATACICRFCLDIVAAGYYAHSWSMRLLGGCGL